MPKNREAKKKRKAELAKLMGEYGASKNPYCGRYSANPHRRPDAEQQALDAEAVKEFMLKGKGRKKRLSKSTYKR